MGAEPNFLVNLEGLEGLMLARAIAGVVDHTLLPGTHDEAEAFDDPYAGEFNEFLEQTNALSKQSVLPYALCVHSGRLGSARRFLNSNDMGGVKLASVIGFPVGSEYRTQDKVLQTIQAIDRGADEIDMVLNYDALLKGESGAVYDDIAAVVQAAKGCPVKVIVENSALKTEAFPNGSDPSYIQEACRLVGLANAAFIKTSTGKHDYGAKPEDVALMRNLFARGVKMAGGVNPANLMEMLGLATTRSEGGLYLLDPAFVRIGTSSLLPQLVWPDGGSGGPQY